MYHKNSLPKAGVVGFATTSLGSMALLYFAFSIFCSSKLFGGSKGRKTRRAVATLPTVLSSSSPAFNLMISAFFI